jgi:hypothetical protein
MSDDSFIREVNEELRQDQAKALLRKYGVYAVAVIVVVLLATAGYVGYRYWHNHRSGTSGDDFARAMALADEGKNDEALTALRAVISDGHASYPLLARMGIGTVLANQGDFAGAVAEFDAVAASSVPAPIRDIARLRAGLLLVDHGSYADVSSRVETLTADTNPMRHSAREALGLAAWKEGRAADALKFFEQIENDQGAPANTRRRATVMTELIRGSGTTG